jgi:threonine dehydratase
MWQKKKTMHNIEAKIQLLDSFKSKGIYINMASVSELSFLFSKDGVVCAA